MSSEQATKSLLALSAGESMSSWQKLATARLWFTEKFPYLSPALHMTVPMFIKGIPTPFCTADWLVCFNPEEVEKQTVQEVGTDLYHELSHLLNEHHVRRKVLDAEPGAWNAAGDRAINCVILEHPECKFSVNVCMPSDIGMPNGLTAEEYYAHRYKDKASGGPQRGDGSGCGSGAGKPSPHEPAPGAFKRPDGRTRTDVKWAVAATAKAIKDREIQQGSVPAGWKRWADLALKPSRISWQQKLARAFRFAVASRPGAVNYTYSRPSRRQGSFGYGSRAPIMPNLVQPKPKVLIAGDTSGSMGEHELGAILREGDAIVKAAGDDVSFAAIDAEVHTFAPVTSWQQIVKLLKGGGGTDFTPLFAQVRKMQAPPEVIIFVTDGCGTCPAEAPPGVLVIWVLVGVYKTREYINFGEIIEVEEEEISGASTP